MKKISILIISIIYSLCAIAQQTPLNDLVSISIPKEAKKLTKENLKSAVTSKAKHFPEIDRKRSIGDFYQVNDILIQLNGAIVPIKKNYLEETKKGDAEISSLDGSLPPHYESSIKAINNYRVLVITYANPNVSCYRFYSISNTNDAALNGVLEFKESDRGQAKEILDKMLKSIKFKK